MSEAAERVHLPRLRPLNGFVPLFSWGMKLTFRRRRILIVAIVSGLVGVLIATQGIGRRAAFHRAFSFGPVDRPLDLWWAIDEQLLPYVIPLVALTLVAQGYQREVQERTLVYHLVRPVSRGTVFLARFCAGVLAAMLVALVPMYTTIALSQVSLPPSLWLGIGVVTMVGVLAIGAVYYALSALLKHGTIAALVYTFVIENLLAQSTGTMQTLSLTFHVKSLYHRLADGTFTALSDQVRRSIEQGARTSSDWVTSDSSGLLPDADRVAWDSPGTALLCLAVIAVAFLAFSVYRLSRRDFALKD